MDTQPVTPERLSASVIAVPPLARNADYSLNPEENLNLVRHLEKGGVRSLLYGGNANFYHLRLSEFASTLELIADCAGDDTLVIPSVGPAWGLAMDQLSVLRDFDFPTVMMLPQTAIATDAGVEAGLRQFAEAYGKPIVLYIKEEGYLEPESAKRLVEEGHVSWIKYAIVRSDPRQDETLRRLVDLVDPRLIVSGIGEQPAIVHLRDFGVNSFTSGCVCVRPEFSMAMLEAIQAENWERAEAIRTAFSGLEAERDSIYPIRVLHAAVSLAGIAETGPLTPLLSNLEDTHLPSLREAVSRLQAEEAFAAV